MLLISTKTIQQLILDSLQN